MGDPPRRKVIIARVKRPHGVRGSVLVEDLTGGAFIPEVGDVLFLELPGGVLEAELADVKEVPGGYICRLAGFDNRERAAGLRNVYVSFPRGSLPELETDDYYFFDLIGLPVLDTAGDTFGEVTGVLESAGGILEVKTGKGELLIPFARKYIREIVPGVKVILEDLPRYATDED